MRLNPRYLKTYAPEEIDKMEWEALESAITLWIQHFQFAVKDVFVAEKQLCKQVLSGVMDGAVWPECFAKIADKIMAVFFRFGEGVARSSKEPQKLFKLLDMYDALDCIRTEFFQVFDGESGMDICSRFRELQKLLIHAASKVFWEFGLQIEGLQDGAPPPPDGSVPKIVRYAVNYLKCLAGSGYAAAMGQVLRTEQTWRAGFSSRPETDESLLREAVSNALDALQRNVESKRSRYRDKVLPHVLAMNTYWYMYMRTRGSELARLVGEQTMKKKYKTGAEEAAYSYQAQAWSPLVKLLEREESLGEGRDGAGAVARGKMEAFMREFEENLTRHKNSYCIPDADLREQIKEAVATVVVPAYAGFLHSYSGVMQGRSFLPPDSIRELLNGLFDGERIEERRKSVSGDGRANFRRREFRNQAGEERAEEEEEREDERRGGRFRRKGSFGRTRREESGGSFGRMEESRGVRLGRRDESVAEGGQAFEGFERKEEGRLVGREEKGDVGRREFKTRGEEEAAAGGGRGTAAIEAGTTYIRRREFRKREEAKGEGEDREGEGEGFGAERGKMYFGRRRQFKTRREGRSGPLDDGRFN